MDEDPSWYVCMYVCIYMYVCMYVCMYVRTYVCILERLRIHQGIGSIKVGQIE